MRTCVVVFGVALCLAGIAGLVAILALRHYEAMPEFKYGIVFDAGSSGTRLYLYHWPSKKVASTGLVSQDHACRVSGGLSNYASDPCSAGPSLTACLDQAKQRVPKQQHASTQLYLAATAGMRLLNDTRPVAAESIMSSVRSTLRASGFGFGDDRQVRIISGQEEGVASWITINYVEGKLLPAYSSGGGRPSLSAGVTPADTYGVLDLGGASTQITFADYSDATPWNYTANVTLLANAHRLYSYSFQCYGVNEALNIYYAHLIKQAPPATFVIEDPCAPRGHTENRTADQLLESPCSSAHIPEDIADSDETLTYTFNGTASASECQSRVRGLFDFTNCTFTACWFAGVYMPSNITAIDFTAISGYYHVASNFQLANATKPLTTRVEFLDRADSVCGFSWDQARKEFKRDPHKQCFHGQYAYTLLTNGYRLGDREWQRIRFAKEVNSTDFNWALGYMLELTNSLPSLPDPVHYVSQPAYISVLVVATLLLIGGLCAAVFARKRMAWQKASISAGVYAAPKHSSSIALV